MLADSWKDCAGPPNPDYSCALGGHGGPPHDCGVHELSGLGDARDLVDVMDVVGVGDGG